MSPTIPPTAGHWAAIGRCNTCGARVVPDGFRDRRSLEDFRITRCCQRCQDRCDFATSDDGHRRYPIRRGALAAVAAPAGAPAELGVLPFLLIAPEARIAWEPRQLLRAGERLAPLNPWDELLALRPAIEGHQVRLTELDDLRAPEVRAALDVDLALVRDASARERLERLAAPGAGVVALADALPRRTLHGLELEALAGGAPPGSVLAECALLAVALEHRAGGLTPLRLVVRAHRARFPELDPPPHDG